MNGKKVNNRPFVNILNYFSEDKYIKFSQDILQLLLDFLLTMVRTDIDGEKVVLKNLSQGCNLIKKNKVLNYEKIFKLN